MPRTHITRLPQRTVTDQDAMELILQEALVAHLAYNHQGEVYSIPSGFVYLNNNLYVHGSVGSFYLRLWAQSAYQVCASVCLIDGLVYAKSVFDSSVNYRSVVCFGHTFEVADDAEKMHILAAFTEKMMPGRWNDVRQPSKSELQKTLVIGIKVAHQTAKMRQGMPSYPAHEQALPTWAGVVPLGLAKGEPITDNFSKEIQIPNYI